LENSFLGREGERERERERWKRVETCEERS